MPVSSTDSSRRGNPSRSPNQRWFASTTSSPSHSASTHDALDGELGASIFAGNTVPEGATPIAQAYAGHQFGGFTPQLGDGRALLLGEIVDPAGERFDIALKGSGRTPFSRGGDGRAALGPVLREYLMGEAMHALGIPTTRALAAVTTGEPVLRDRALPGAVLDACGREPPARGHVPVLRRARRHRQAATAGRLRRGAPRSRDWPAPPTRRSPSCTP